MKNIPIILLFCILKTYLSLAQTAEPSSGIDKNFLQIEMEGQYLLEKEDTVKEVTWAIPSMLFRYGLFQNIELQMNLPLIQKQHFENDVLLYDTQVLDQILLGTSANLWSQNKFLPEAAFMAKFCIPFQLEGNWKMINNIVALNFSNTINDSFSLNYNIGYVNCHEAIDSAYYILNLNYNLSDKIHFFIENFSDFTKPSDINHNINMGGGINISDSMFIDASVAKGLSQQTFYSSLRFTWYLNTANAKNS